MVPTLVENSKIVCVLVMTLHIRDHEKIWTIVAKNITPKPASQYDTFVATCVITFYFCGPYLNYKTLILLVLVSMSDQAWDIKLGENAPL